MIGRGSLAAGITLLAIAGLPSTAAAEPGDTVAGSGSGQTLFNQEQEAVVGAHSGPLGENPNGHLRLDRQGALFFKGKVECLSAVANRAGVAGEIEQHRFNPNQFFVRGLGVEDNDESALGGPDRIVMGTVQGTREQVERFACPALVSVVQGIGGRPITQGNFVVRDTAPALPGLRAEEPPTLPDGASVQQTEEGVVIRLP